MASFEDGSENKVLDMLNQLTLNHELHSHDIAMTVADQATIIGHLPGMLTKNIFLRGKG